ncbi:MAG: hypothetical protein KAS04_02805 [Candidatus Aenigmarchaeota archaeon]|nr:hypothetical protein [Candidatus Aenigmarchaeota archaeon]
MMDIFGSLIPVIGIIIVIIFGIALRVSMKEKKSGFPIKDERTMYVEGRVGHYSTTIGIWFMLGLMWYTFLGAEFFGIPEMNATQVLIISIIVMAGLSLGLRFYFNRRGDA